MGQLLTFFPLVFAVAFVCTAVKDYDQQRIMRNTWRLFAYLSGGSLELVLKP